MSTAQEQVTRLLAMIPYLQAHPGVAVTQVAQAFGVPKKQVIQDLKIAWMCGLPGGTDAELISIDMDAVEGEGRIHLGNADYLIRPLRFTVDEAMSLIVALRVVRELASGSAVAAVDSALAKLEALTDADDVRRVAIRVDSGPAPVRDAITAAIANKHQLRLTYDGVTRSLTTTPVVDPVRLDLRDGVAYLQAWSVDRDAWRTYRLDRIIGVEATGQSTIEHGPLPTPHQVWFDDVGVDNRVTLALAPAAAWIVEYFPTVETPSRFHKRRQRDEIVATFPVADPAWLTSLLLRLGAHVRVLDPLDAAAPARARAREALDLADRVFSASKLDRESATRPVTG